MLTGLIRNISENPLKIPMSATTTLLLSVVFGSFGLGYIAYGKSQRKAVAMASGLALCGLPFLFSNVYLSIGVGCCLLAAPFFIRV